MVSPGSPSGDPSSTSTGTDSYSTVLADETTPLGDPLASPGPQITIPLTVDLEFCFTRPMTDEEKQAARDRCGIRYAPRAHEPLLTPLR